MHGQAHWEEVYRTHRSDEVSWYRPHLELSLALIETSPAGRDARVIDVGGGESTLVDDLLDRGYGHVTVLDLSSTALEIAQARLGKRASSVEWICADITTASLPEGYYDVWHDRAVFHFLASDMDRAAYVSRVAHAVKPGGLVIVATFGPEGPTKCSGLDVVRYAPDALHAQFGPRFELAGHHTELHTTPAGRIQQFTYCYCRNAPAAVADAPAAHPRIVP